jgi:hypothetical protein
VGPRPLIRVFCGPDKVIMVDMRRLILASLVFLIGVAAPAVACECSSTDFVGTAIDADFIVVGRIVSTDRSAPAWTMQFKVAEVLRGNPPAGLLTLGGLGSSCEYGLGEFTVADGLDRVWAFALKKDLFIKGRYFMGLCSRPWARLKTPELGGDYTETELHNIARKGRP